MPDREWMEMLTAASGEVLETMFFTEIRGIASERGAAAESGLGARLRFEGTPSGVLTVRVSEPALRGLAANFLASEPDEDAADPQLELVMAELANMICGSLLSRVKTETQFRLLSPESLTAANCPLEPPDESLIVGDGDGGGSLDLWLAVEQHAD